MQRLRLKSRCAQDTYVFVFGCPRMKSVRFQQCMRVVGLSFLINISKYLRLKLSIKVISKKLKLNCPGNLILASVRIIIFTYVVLQSVYFMAIYLFFVYSLNIFFVNYF
uniref:Uncharacterized protein n=1 Tax=Cacopsylla melanoneura TaxID=428564 RepID=A0A8D8SYR7_9HEMI